MPNSNPILTTTGEPVPGFPLNFTWSTGDWQRIFDEQIKLVKADVARARADNRLLIYLSCPISARGGGWSGTNVDIALHVERLLLERWGEAFWVLNPAQYQLESKAGQGLINQHAATLKIDLAALMQQGEPSGGDYMRMWTKALVEDNIDNLGRNFDAFYFLGPRDVHSFFSRDETITLTTGVEAYFARKICSDADFHDGYAVPGIVWGNSGSAGAEARRTWSKLRQDFMRFYGLRASAAFSLGSHDEWEIFRLINALRREKTATASMIGGDTGDQVSGFFDGVQIDPASAQTAISPGYAAPNSAP